MSRYRQGLYGIEEKLRKEDLGKVESGGEIWKKLPRGSNGEATLTPELIQAFDDLLMEGNTRSNAACVVGLSKKTMTRWIRQGAADIDSGRSSLEAEFTWMVDRCEGEQRRQLARSAFRAAMSPGSDGTLALKILERRDPEEWAPALPEGADAAAQFAGMQKAALQNEAKRILALAAKDNTDEVVVNVEQRPEQQSGR